MASDSKKYECLRCGWIYDPAEGDPDGGIKPGTPFKDIPKDLEMPGLRSLEIRFRGIFGISVTPD